MKPSKSPALTHRLAAMATILFAAVLSLGVLSSCGESTEQIITDSLTAELDSIKNMDESFMSELSSDPSIQDLEEFGIDTNKFIASYLNGFDYRIEGVSVEDDTATATVVLTTKGFQEFNNALETALGDILNSPDLATMGEEQIYAAVGEKVMAAIESITPQETDPIQITYQLVDDTWTPTEDSTASLESALLGN